MNRAEPFIYLDGFQSTLAEWGKDRRE